MIFPFVLVCCLLATVASSDIKLDVDTTYGTVRGHTTERLGPQIREWKGIPFATPPVGDLRWEYPTLPSKFSEVYEADINVLGCQQTCKLPPGNCPDYGQSEDCLYLTVTAPLKESSDPNGYPVFFWLHGGAYTQGIGASPLYDGSQFSINDVVVVTINYRLGALGFMASPDQKGNYGFMDQRMALQWTKDNVAGFGGDPSRVTVAGQSAGAMSVGTHMVSQGSKGLFSKAIMESNCLGMPYHTRDTAATNAEAMFKYLNCDKSDVACMKSKTVEEVLDAQDNAVKMDRKTLFINFLPFAPMVEEGGEIPQQPLYAFYKGEFNAMPLLVGSVADEGVLFVNELFTDPMSKTKYHTTIDVLFGLHKAKQIKKMYPMLPDSKDGRDAFNVLATDLIFYCPLRNITRGMQQTLGVDTVPISEYRFDHVISFDPWGPDYSFCVGKVCHGSELPFVFNVFGTKDINYDSTADEKKLTVDISDAWANFINSKSGDANSPLTVPMTFPALTPNNDEIVLLDEPGYNNVEDPRKEQCDMWDTFGYFY
jgi:acetylcholinesterase/cholinesterase